MPRPSKEQLQAFWDFADKNGDGKLDIQEFKKAVVHYRTQGGQAKCAPPSDREITNLFQSLNDNNDKYLTKEEYLNHLDKEERNVQNLEKAFKEFDKNGDGTISRDELRQLMQKHGMKPSDVDLIIQAVDKDGDGNIDFNEFMAAM